MGIGIALLVLRSMEAEGGTFNRNAFQRLVLLSLIPAFLAVLVLAVGVRETRRAPKAASDIRPAARRHAWDGNSCSSSG